MVHQLVLLESGAHSATAPRATWAVASTALHAALIAGAVLLTMQATTHAASESRETVVVYRAPGGRVAAHAAPSIPRVPGRITLPSFVMPTVPGIRMDIPLPQHGSITDRIDPMGLGSTATGGVGTDVRGSGVAPGDVHASESVDRVVVPRPSNPAPEYPAALRAANVAGEVLVRFVVDTTGVVEPASVQVLQATHEAFAQSVRAWLRRTRYQPAELQGQRVRQLVEQRVNFTLER